MNTTDESMFGIQSNTTQMSDDRNTIVVSNSSENSFQSIDYPSMQSIHDFSADEDVEEILRESFRTAGLSRPLEQPSSLPNSISKKPRPGHCQPPEQTVDDELRRLKSLKSFQVLNEGLDMSHSPMSGRRSRAQHLARKVTDVEAPPSNANAKEMTPTLSALDSLVDMATRMFHVSIAVISLANLGQEEVLAARGLDGLQELGQQLPCNAFASMCSSESLVVVPDLSQDSEFSSRLPVRGARFYAGVPLLSPEGERVGVLSIMDAPPRFQGLSENEQRDLRHLAGFAMHVLVERRTRLQLDRKLQQAANVVSATCNDLLTPMSAAELALSLLNEDQDFQAKLSEHQRESIKIATNCVGVMGRLCNSMRDQHSANCMQEVNAVTGIDEQGDPIIRHTSSSNAGLSTDSFRIMYGTGSLPNEQGEASVNFELATQSLRTDSRASAVLQEKSVLFPTIVEDLVKSIQCAADAIPKTIPTTIALHAAVPPCIMTDDLKIVRCALNSLQRCAAITESGSIRLTIQPQYCRCGKATLDFHCQINPDGKRSIIDGLDKHECCSTNCTSAFGKDTSEVTSPRLCCHSCSRTESKSLKNCSEINVFSVAMQMDALGGDCGFGSLLGSGPKDDSFWFRVPLVEAQPLADDPPRALALPPISHEVSDTSNSVDEDETIADGAEKPERVAVMKPQPRKRRALVIEDSVVIRKVISNALAKIGIEVETAVNGMEGLHHMQWSFYDVVLCDFLMPVMDGLDCIRQYREWEKINRPFLHQYIIGMSAHASVKDVERGIDAGMDAYKPKPLTYKGLKEIMAACKVNREKGFTQTLTSFGSRPTIEVYDRLETEKMCLIASSDAHGELAKLAEAKGWRSWITQNGEDTLQALKKRHWDLVILDDKLPLVPGKKCAIAFRKWEQENRIGLQTNVFLLTDQRQMVPAGTNGVLKKPAQQNEFEKVLESARNQSLHILMR